MKTQANGDWQLHPQLASDTHPLAQFRLCELRLMDDTNYPWLVLVPRVAGAQELIDLRGTERHLLADEIDEAARALRAVFRPRKLNVAALGNIVPQLHVHVIARYEDDPAWPAPVWGRVAARPHTPEQLVDRVTRLQGALRD
jgi:diadenosine tetraphosphate (Ap4A) HIT family hydrolase